MLILNLLTKKEKADKEGWMKTLYDIYELQLTQITADLSESGQHGPIGVFRKDAKN